LTIQGHYFILSSLISSIKRAKLQAHLQTSPSVCFTILLFESFSSCRCHYSHCDYHYMMFGFAAKRSLSVPAAARRSKSLTGFLENINTTGRRYQNTAAASLATKSDHFDSNNAHHQRLIAAAAALLSTAAAVSTLTTTTSCDRRNSTPNAPSQDAKKSIEVLEHYGLTPADVGKENFEAVQASHDINSMPIYTSDQVAENNGEDGKPIWMSYGGMLYKCIIKLLRWLL